MRHFLVLALALCLVPALATAQVPAKVAYQGRLLGADGTPVSGVQKVTFALFSQDAGGTALWSEPHDVAFTDGYYSVFLGDTVSFPAGTFDGTERFLELSLGSEHLAPRQRIVSVPYALVSGSGGGLAAVSVAAPLSGSGTSASPVTLPRVSATTDGYLAASDWASVALLNRDNQTITGATQVFKSGANSTKALQVQKAGGAAVLDVDTVNARVGVGTATPAQALDVVGNVNASGKLMEGGNPLLPKGMIVMWSGTLATLPAGWALCDGTNGTPDLRDRFVAGAGAGKDPGETGGANTIVLTQNELPAHSHSLTINAVGDHKHGVPVPWTGAPTVPAVSYANTVPASSLGNMLTEAGGAHTHTGSIGSAGSGQGFDNRPVYLKLAFIMKL